MYGSNFKAWYAAQKYKEKNFFGNYNGMNLQGFDPLEFYRAARSGKIGEGLSGYIKSLPTALVVRVYTRNIPDFVRNYPTLADVNGEDCGWDIHFTWYGLPKKFERIKNPRVGAKGGEVEIVSYNPEEISRKCRRLIIVRDGQAPRLTKDLKNILNKIFM